MRAVVCRAFGPPEALAVEDMSAPAPGPGEVLVDVAAIGVNFTDLLAIEGRSQLKRQMPFVPGVELAGTVASVGEAVEGLRPGQRVLGACIHGAYAKQAALPPDALYPIPDEMDFPTASAFFIASMTSRYALVERARLTAGETLLVLGAGSGAGVAA